MPASMVDILKAALCGTSGKIRAVDTFQSDGEDLNDDQLVLYHFGILMGRIEWRLTIPPTRSARAATPSRTKEIIPWILSTKKDPTPMSETKVPNAPAKAAYPV